MRKQTKKNLLGILAVASRKIERAMPEGKRADILAAVPYLRTAAQTVERELPAEEQEVYLSVLTGMETALQQLPAGASVDACRETATLLQELLQYLRQQVRQARTTYLLVFLPYKAAMWDSMESIWQAAEQDPAHCQTLVMPLPYADRNPDGTAAAWHNDIDKFPAYVPVVDSRTVDLSTLRPDAIFIHNPYDGGNLAISVDMDYYSDKLARYTDMLVYVPYYVTSGGMGEFQRDLPVYEHVDYIIAQSDYGKLYYAESCQDKILPLGSPKLDKAARMAANPPEPPEDWREKMAGRTVYFYNTSVNGFLADSPTFLKKMAYVFQCFRGRKDACLLWRPHPLLAATMESIHPELVPQFQQLKDQFLQEDFGIYDTTPNIEASIALSDVYIGDSATSVTALFGAAGKPLFILNNLLTRAPQAGDAHSFVLNFTQGEPENWVVMGNNQLWHREADGSCHYAAQLSDWNAGQYLAFAIERHGRTYICPLNAEKIVVREAEGRLRHIPLKQADMPYWGRFINAVADERYLFLIPLRYPYLVRMDLETEEIRYVEGVQPFVAGCTADHVWLGGACCLKDGLLYLGAPFSTAVMVLQEETLETQQLTVGHGPCGTRAIAVDGDELWLLPMQGGLIRRWNPQTGAVRAYDAWVDGYACHVPFHEEEASQAQPFSSAGFTRDQVILAPFWGDGFVCLDKESGRADRWQTPEPLRRLDERGYFFAGWNGMFIRPIRSVGGSRYHYYQAATHRLYDVDLLAGSCEELPLRLDPAELRQHAPGFARLNEWIQYGCEENAVQTLGDLLDGRLPGASHDRQEQLAAYGESAANIGTSGQVIYETILGKLEEKGL